MSSPKHSSKASAPETRTSAEQGDRVAAAWSGKQHSDWQSEVLANYREENKRLRDSNSELLAALKGVAGDSIAMRGFHEAFRNQVRAAIARAEEAAS